MEGVTESDRQIQKESEVKKKKSANSQEAE